MRILTKILSTRLSAPSRKPLDNKSVGTLCRQLGTQLKDVRSAMSEKKGGLAKAKAPLAKLEQTVSQLLLGLTSSTLGLTSSDYSGLEGLLETLDVEPQEEAPELKPKVEFDIKDTEKWIKVYETQLKAIKKMDVDISNGITAEYLEKKEAAVKKKLAPLRAKLQMLQKSQKNTTSSSKTSLQDTGKSLSGKKSSQVKMMQSLAIDRLRVLVGVIRCARFSQPVTKLPKAPVDELLNWQSALKDIQLGIARQLVTPSDVTACVGLLGINQKTPIFESLSGSKPMETLSRQLTTAIDTQLSQLAETQLTQLYESVIKTGKLGKNRLSVDYVPRKLSKLAQKKLNILLDMVGVDTAAQENLSLEDQWMVLTAKLSQLKVTPSLFLELIPKGPEGKALDQLMSKLEKQWQAPELIKAMRVIIGHFRTEKDKAENEAQELNAHRWQMGEKRFGEIVEIMLKVGSELNQNRDKTIDALTAQFNEFYEKYQAVCSVGIDFRVFTLKSNIETSLKGGESDSQTKGLTVKIAQWAMWRIEEVLRNNILIISQDDIDSEENYTQEEFDNLSQFIKDHSTDVHHLNCAVIEILKTMGYKGGLSALEDPYECEYGLLITRQPDKLTHLVLDIQAFLKGVVVQLRPAVSSTAPLKFKAALDTLETAKLVQTTQARDLSPDEIDQLVTSCMTNMTLTEFMKLESIALFHEKLVASGRGQGVLGIAAKLGNYEVFLQLLSQFQETFLETENGIGQLAAMTANPVWTAVQQETVSSQLLQSNTPASGKMSLLNHLTRQTKLSPDVITRMMNQLVVQVKKTPVPQKRGLLQWELKRCLPELIGSCISAGVPDKAVVDLFLGLATRLHWRDQAGPLIDMIKRFKKIAAPIYAWMVENAPKVIGAVVSKSPPLTVGLRNRQTYLSAVLTPTQANQMVKALMTAAGQEINKKDKTDWDTVSELLEALKVIALATPPKYMRGQFPGVPPSDGYYVSQKVITQLFEWMDTHIGTLNSAQQVSFATQLIGLYIQLLPVLAKEKNQVEKLEMCLKLYNTGVRPALEKKKFDRKFKSMIDLVYKQEVYRAMRDMIKRCQKSPAKLEKLLTLVVQYYPENLLKQYCRPLIIEICKLPVAKKIKWDQILKLAKETSNKTAQQLILDAGSRYKVLSPIELEKLNF